MLTLDNNNSVYNESISQITLTRTPTLTYIYICIYQKRAQQTYVNIFAVGACIFAVSDCIFAVSGCRVGALSRCACLRVKIRVRARVRVRVKVRVGLA